MPRERGDRSAGFTIVELVIALTVVSIGVIGIISVLTLAEAETDLVAEDVLPRRAAVVAVPHRRARGRVHRRGLPRRVAEAL